MFRGRTPERRVKDERSVDREGQRACATRTRTESWKRGDTEDGPCERGHRKVPVEGDRGNPERSLRWKNPEGTGWWGRESKTKLRKYLILRRTTDSQRVRVSGVFHSRTSVPGTDGS